VLAVLVAPLGLSPHKMFLLATSYSTAVVVLALTILTGWSGQVSLGHWAIAGVAGVFGSRLVGVWHLPFFLTLLAVAVVGGVVALLIGLPALRLPGALLAVVTLGFAVVCESWLYDKSWFKGNGSLDRPAWITNRIYYYLAALILAVAVVAVRSLQRSRIGRNLVAVRDNPGQAAAFGIPVVRTRLTGFVLSGVVAAIGGFWWSAGVATMSPNAFPALRSLSVLCAAIIGGLGSVFGALLGTAYLSVSLFVPDEAARYVGLLSTGIGLLLLICFFPGGLARIAGLGRDWLAERITGIDPRPDVQPVELADESPDVPTEDVLESVLEAENSPLAAGSRA
jgi:branched-chain amino acid transport system permease protein